MNQLVKPQKIDEVPQYNFDCLEDDDEEEEEEEEIFNKEKPVMSEQKGKFESVEG